MYASPVQRSTIRKTGKDCDLLWRSADSYVGLAFTELDDIIDYIKDHSVVNSTDTEIGRR